MRVRSLILLLLLWAVPVEAQLQRIPGALAYTANAQTCADSGDGSAGALTVTVSSISYVAVTQNDAHGCALTLSESGAQDGQVLIVVNLSANSASFADSSGVQEMTGGTSLTLAQWASAGFVYRSDRWVAAGGGASASGSITSSGYTQSTARILGRTTASTGAIEELSSVPATLGGTGLTALCADDEVLVSSGAVYACKDIPDCNTITEKLLYDDSANTFSCETDQTASGAGSGNVTGPAGATDEAIARFDTTTGELLQDSAVTLSNGGLFTFPDGVTQVFNPDGTNSGLNVGSVAGDPSSADNGDVWYDSSANELTARINGSNVALGAMVKIDEVVTSGSQTTVTFSGIPGTYRHLRAVFAGRVTSAGSANHDIYLQFNGDTGTNYYRQLVFGVGTTVGANESIGTATPAAFTAPEASVTAGLSGSGDLIFPFYADTTFHKTASGVNTSKTSNSGSGTVVLTRAIHWANTAAITSIVFGVLTSGGFVDGSIITLYGLN